MQTGRTKRQQAEETRGRLLEAAVELFAAQGYDSTTIDDICRAAGRARGAFYVHFSSRADIFRAVVAACDSLPPLLLLDALARAGRDGPEAAALRQSLADLLPSLDDLDDLLATGALFETAPAPVRRRKAA